MTDTTRKRGRKKQHSLFTRERIQVGLGVFIVVFELVNAELLGRTFHYEFLVLAAGLFGLAIAGWGDKKSGG